MRPILHYYIYDISKSGDGVNDILDYLEDEVCSLALPADQMSDLPSRVLAAEITREQLFLYYDRSCHAITVETEKWKSVLITT